jgi:hypothetical protein
VLDTNVLTAAARSRQGASYALVSSIPAAEFEPCLSVALLITHNVSDFHGSEQLGVTAVTPRDFLKLIRKKT